MLDLTRAFQDAPKGQWTTLSYSLSCFSAHNADLSNLAAPFAIATDGQFSLTIADIRLISRHGAAHCGGA
jgi:beta-glucosidase